VLTIIFIALYCVWGTLQEERVYWYGRVKACGRGFLRHGLYFSTAWCTTRPNAVENDWKHVLMQNVVTLNTCCDIACLTFQLPYITTGSFQSLQRLKERNKPSVRWKKFAIHKSVWWHFQVGWASGLQIVFLWDNVNNQNYVWIILLKMTFLDIPRYSGYMWQVRCQIFSGFHTPTSH